MAGVVQVTIDPVFSRALARQREMQAFLLGKYVTDLEPDELARFIRDQAFALNAEVHETVDETHWKPWAVRPENEPVVINKTRYIGEMADVFIFMMNLMLAGDVTTVELMMAVNAKQDKNMNRWITGYDAKATKCRGCGRSFDDDGVGCYAAVSPETTGSLPILAFCAQKERFIDQSGNVIP